MLRFGGWQLADEASSASQTASSAEGHEASAERKNQDVPRTFRDDDLSFEESTETWEGKFMAISDVAERLRLSVSEPLRSQLPYNSTAMLESNVVLTKIVVVETAGGELRTLKDLQAFVTERIRALQGIDLRNVMLTLKAFDDGPKHQDSKRMLHELRTRAWGKAIYVRSVDGGPIKAFRITQANYGAPKLGVIARGTAIAQQLVSADLGDEVQIPDGTYEVVGVAHFEPDSDPENFRRMDLQHVDLAQQAWLEDVARELKLRTEELVLLFRGEPIEEPVPVPAPEVQRTDVERLGAHFYTRATALQEDLMRSEEGLAAIIGVAGSGKTSVALGRTKMLVDRVPPDEGEPSVPFYRSESAVGFVLSGQLCDYLEKTCQQLALYDMPVQEFHQLRSRLFELRRLDETGFAQSIDETAHSLHTTMAWLRAADLTIANTLSNEIVDAVRDPPKERESAKKLAAKRSAEQEATLLRLWAEMVRGIEGVADTLSSIQVGARFHLERLASKVDVVRHRFANDLEKAAAFNGPDHKELRQNIRNTLRERMVRALRLPEAYAKVLANGGADPFSKALLRFVDHTQASDIQIAVAEASLRLGSKKLTDADVDVLLGLAHVISIGYRGRGDRDPISHLTEPDWYSQVFIDEFQDFSEVQIFLMGAQAHPERRTVTVVGDHSQKLHQGRRIRLAEAFPWAERTQTQPAVLLENKRQTGRLAALSERFREDILGDRPEKKIDFPTTGSLARFVATASDQVHGAIYQEVLRLPRHLSVAVICPSDATAYDLERSLRDRLGTSFRDTKHSKRGDLLRRYYVHFTTPLDAKGLEFDAAVVAMLEQFDLDDPLQANGCYVAVSRPRKVLSLIGERDRLDKRWNLILDSDLIEHVNSSTVSSQDE